MRGFREMAYRMRVLALFLLGPFGVAPLAHAHEPVSRAGSGAEALAMAARPAAAVVDAFHAALQRGDRTAVAAHLSADVLIFEGGSAEQSKAEYLAGHLAADIAFEQAVPSTSGRRHGGAVANMAWIATEGRTTGSYKGKSIDQITTESMILRRSGSGWKIVHIHWSSAAAKAR